jgi:hypothetical protein
MTYLCEICSRSFTSLYNRDRHKNTKKHIINEERRTNINDGINGEGKNIIIKKYTCPKCIAEFKTKPSLRRHELHRCSKNEPYYTICDNLNDTAGVIPVNNNNGKNELYTKIIKLIDNISNTKYKQKGIYKSAKLMDTNSGSINNNYINTTINTINNTIIINSYGRENVAHITAEYMTMLLQKYTPLAMVPKLIEDIHFNKSYPENKNIIYPNKKEKLIRIFRNNKWNYEKKTYIVDEIIEDNCNILDDHYALYYKTLSIDKRMRYNEFRKDYDNENVEVIHSLQHSCEMILLNNR